MKIIKKVEMPVLQFYGAVEWAVLEDGLIIALFVNRYDAEEFFKTFVDNFDSTTAELVPVRLEH